MNDLLPCRSCGAMTYYYGRPARHWNEDGSLHIHEAPALGDVGEKAWLGVQAMMLRLGVIEPAKAPRKPKLPVKTLPL